MTGTPGQAGDCNDVLGDSETLGSNTGRVLNLTPVIHLGTQPGTCKPGVRHDTLTVTDVLDNLTVGALHG